MAQRETAAKFPVVMLYDHFDSVGKAMATYSHLTRELEDEYEPDLSVWCIEDAASAEYSTLANQDIAAAEVIIMTVRGDEPFPAAFQHWKGGTEEGGVAPPNAIIALIGSADNPDPAADTWNSVLRGAATQIHPEVFVYEPRPGQPARSAGPLATAGCNDTQPIDINGPCEVQF
jgi:hypothetical protein